MKVELTQELKEKFFAQYYGQNVFKYNGIPIPFMTPDYLSLRPLDQITDEEAIEAAKIIWGKESDKDMHTAEEGRWYLIYRRRPERKEYPELIDFLRSKGFAVPYMGHSVEDLVSAGWVKLIERTDKPE